MTGSHLLLQERKGERSMQEARKLQKWEEKNKERGVKREMKTDEDIARTLFTLEWGQVETS